MVALKRQSDIASGMVVALQQGLCPGFSFVHLVFGLIDKRR
jgi:hypothetical protein